MKIAIINLTRGGMSGGYRKYLLNIIPRLANHPDVDSLLCASARSLNVQDWFESLPNVKFINCRPYRFLLNSLDTELKQHLEKFSSDVLFIPTERYYRFNKVPVVHMVRNMEPFLSSINNNPFSEQFRNWVRSVDAKRTLKKSNRVITVSKYARAFLTNHLNIPAKKIGMVYHGIDSPENRNIDIPDIIPEARDGQFLFTAGSIRPARGLEDVLNALKYLSVNSSNFPILVIAGEHTPRMMRYRKRLENWIKVNNLSSKVCWAGRLNEQEMSWCYQNCRAFIMTSRVESFGMIAGEAISHGCVCISANNPCLPEIFGDTAIYYPHKNGKALAEAIQAVLSWNDQYRMKMSERARKRSREFSWDVTAQKTVEELKKAIEDF